MVSLCSKLRSRVVCDWCSTRKEACYAVCWSGCPRGGADDRHSGGVCLNLARDEHDSGKQDLVDGYYSARRIPSPSKSRMTKERMDIVGCHSQLNPEDTETQTLGCRHSNPNVCGKNGLEDVCAFVREDRLCLAPPRSWPKQFRKLRQSASTPGKQREAGEA